MNLQETLKHQRAFLDNIKARKEPIIVNVEGVGIKINPGVFSPATDTKLLAANVDIKKGQRFLEMSTGSGAVAVVAGLAGGSGIAIDINPKAVKNARENVATHKVDVKVIESDMYSNVPNEKFDRVYANGPFSEGEIKEVLDKSVYGARNFTRALFSGLGKYLKVDGKALVVFPEWAEVGFFEKCIVDNGLKYKIATKRSSDDGQRIYRLYEITA
jgi:release factor glutamine methyltransferase